MRIADINPPLRPGQKVQCCVCHKFTDRAVADLEGKAFEAFYCNGCRPDNFTVKGVRVRGGLVTPHIENARPGHLALVERFEAALRLKLTKDDMGLSTVAEERQHAAELVEYKGDLLALLRALEEALEEAAEREKGRAKMIEVLQAAEVQMDQAATLLSEYAGGDTGTDDAWASEKAEQLTWAAMNCRAALKAHP